MTTLNRDYSNLGKGRMKNLTKMGLMRPFRETSKTGYLSTIARRMRCLRTSRRAAPNIMKFLPFCKRVLSIVPVGQNEELLSVDLIKLQVIPVTKT